MTKSPNSFNDWQELLAGYVLGNLSPEELIQFNQYLAKNPEKISEVESLQKTLNLLPLSLEETQAPKHLKARIQASALSTTEELELLNQADSPVKEDRSKRKKSSWNKIGAGIAVVAIATLGWQTYRLQQQVNIAESQVEQMLQAQAKSNIVQANFVRYQETVSLLHQPNNRLLSLTALEASVNASGSLLIAPERKIAVLVLQDVPAPPPNKLYQMWAVVNERKVNCIKFRPDRDGTVLLRIPITDWSETPMVTITLEPEGATPQPTGNMVIGSPQIL
jgi:anti-sigma-K factor RskA